MNPTSPLAVLRAWVDAYCKGDRSIPGEELERALDLLATANILINAACFADREDMFEATSWRKQYAAMKGE